MAKSMGQDSAAPKAWSMQADNVHSPLFWAVSTVAFSTLAYACLWPSSCAAASVCANTHQAVPSNLNMHAVSGLSMVLLMELMSLVSTYQGVRETSALVPEIRSRCLPSLLLILMYMVHIGQHAVFTAGWTPWYANTFAQLGGVLDFRPVYTLTFVEWMVNVPLLLVLAGHCALGRPLNEVTKPVLLTNFYIVLSWAALLTTSESLRWMLVVVTFAMYGIASMGMLQWVADYFQEASKDLSNRTLRPCLSVGLIALFAAYGAVYLFAITGVLSVRAERMCFLSLSVGSKLAFSATFVAIRTKDYHNTFSSLLKKMSSSNLGLVSILRGSFDFVLPCDVDASGCCRMPMAKGSADLRSLAAVLGQPLAGADVGELLGDAKERVAFTSYVTNTLRQAQKYHALNDATLSPDGDWSGSDQRHLPPIAQVLNCSLATGGQLDAAGRPKTVQCSIHLSVVPRLAFAFQDKWQVVAAVRLHGVSLPEEEALALVEEENLVATYDGEENKGKMSGMIASLSDIAKLGASALLTSQRGTTEPSCEDSVIAETEGSADSFPAKIAGGKPKENRRGDRIEQIDEMFTDDSESTVSFGTSRQTTEDTSHRLSTHVSGGSCTADDHTWGPVPPMEDSEEEGVKWGPIPRMRSEDQQSKQQHSGNGVQCTADQQSQQQQHNAGTVLKCSASDPVEVAQIASVGAKVVQTWDGMVQWCSSVHPACLGIAVGGLTSVTVLYLGAARARR